MFRLIPRAHTIQHLHKLPAHSSLHHQANKRRQHSHLHHLQHNCSNWKATLRTLLPAQLDGDYVSYNIYMTETIFFTKKTKMCTRKCKIEIGGTRDYFGKLHQVLGILLDMLYIYVR